jgi:hypothetical protein
MKKWSERLSLDARKIFAKDYSVPFKMYGDDYFDYFINLIDKDYGFSHRLRHMELAILEMGENEFLKYRKELPFKIIDHVKKKPAYEKFNNSIIETSSRSVTTSKKGIYKTPNDGRSFISIDLVKANFHSLKSIDSDLVNGKEDYYEFICDFASPEDYEYCPNSKSMRQIIFGNLNPKKQQTIQRNVISEIIKLLVDVLKIDEDLIVASTSDEVIIDITDYNYSIDDLEFEIKSTIKMNIEGFPVRIENFQLYHIGKGCYSKVIHGYDSRIELKNIPGIFFPQVYKFSNRIPLDEKDMMFIQDGCLASFLEPYLHDHY